MTIGTDEWFDPWPGHFTPHIHWTASLVGYRAHLNPCFCQELNPGHPAFSWVIWVISIISKRSLKLKLQLTFPIASNPLSNRSNTPRKRNDTPNPARPTPISATERLKLFSLIKTHHGWSQIYFLLLCKHCCQWTCISYWYFIP